MKKKLLFLLFTAIAFSPFHNASFAQITPGEPNVCYASTGLTDGGRFLTIDPTTGVGTLIGFTGLTGVPGLAINSLGEIFCTST